MKLSADTFFYFATIWLLGIIIVIPISFRIPVDALIMEIGLIGAVCLYSFGGYMRFREATRKKVNGLV